MYLVNEISNRDISLLNCYRILRKPSEFLSAIYNQGEPIVTEIMEGTITDLQSEDGLPLYAFDLGIEPVKGYIPYLEFDPDNDADRKHLETLIYLDNLKLYGKSAEFQEAVQIRVYWVSSLESIKKAIEQYLKSIEELDLSSLRSKFNDKKNQPKGIRAIAGRDENLVEFTNGAEGLTMQDSGYMIASALDAQMLVNPSQELLMSLPRKLKHNINITVTDSSTRYLSSFSGYTISIKGNGNWVIRDTQCGINFVSGKGKIYLWNCKLVHFRNTVSKGSASTGYNCIYLYAHRSLIILNQGTIKDVHLVGGSTMVEVPTATAEKHSGSDLQNVSLIGHGCSLYSWVKPIPVKAENILGLAWWNSLSDSGGALYIGGRRIDEISGEHEEEMRPSKIIEMDVNNVHIHQEE